MKISYDKEIDAQFIQIKSGKVAYTKPENEWLILDYNNQDEIIGIEVLDESKHPLIISTDGTNVVGIDVIEGPIASVTRSVDREEHYVLGATLA